MQHRVARTLDRIIDEMFLAYDPDFQAGREAVDLGMTGGRTSG